MRLRPYDTLEEVIGLRGTPGHGSLREWGVSYRELPGAVGTIDWAALATAIRPGVASYHGDFAVRCMGTQSAIDHVVWYIIPLRVHNAVQMRVLYIPV